jgi:hypothetical protein
MTKEKVHLSSGGKMMRRWVKSPYVKVSLGFLLVFILLSVLPAFTTAYADPEIVGRTLGSIWLFTMVAIAVVRTVRKRILKRQH